MAGLDRLLTGQESGGHNFAISGTPYFNFGDTLISNFGDTLLNSWNYGELWGHLT